MKQALIRIKPMFLREDESLKKALRRQRFHTALSSHPSIVFGYHDERAQGKTYFLRAKVWFLKECIRIGMLKSPKGHKLMAELGMQPYYGNGVDFWFEEGHSPIRPYHIPDNPKPEGRIAVYTALMGDYDHVHDILYKENGIDYVLFTNNPSLKSSSWKIVLVENELDNVLQSREIKMLPHKYLGDEYDISVYVDANVVIYGEITELTRFLDNTKSFAVSRHGERSTLESEVGAIIRQLGVDQVSAWNQYKHYLENGFEDNIGLAECNVLVRKHNNESVIELMNLWWKEFQKGIKRDQISLMPCIEQLHFEKLAWMDGGSSRHNQFCTVVAHKKN